MRPSSPRACVWVRRYGASPCYADSLRSLVCVNGYSTADAQLSAILHSSINVFSSLPDNRPDLPVSYFSRFLFSEARSTDLDRSLGYTLP